MAKAQRLILASASEGRRDLLRRAGIAFEVIPSGIEEPHPRDVSDPRAYVQQVAWLKAAAVADRVDEGLVLAADSVGWHAGQVILKPVDRADARRILQQLGGNRHHLWTGVCLWRRPDNLQLAWQEASVVEMKTFAAPELEAYLASGVWEGKSGAYAIQERDDPYVRVLEGTASNVVGLPLETLNRVLDWLAR
jgi:septum formation protein